MVMEKKKRGRKKKCDSGYNKDNKLRVFTAFSGYDSQCMALDSLKEISDFDYELVGWSEIDKYAIQAHNALFPQYKDRNYGDISKINWEEVPDFDFFTYSSPCTDFSQAGFQRGGDEGSGTRSSLLWECRKAINNKKPKYLLFENVKALISDKFIHVFKKWCKELEKYGYNNYYQVLNAKDYGIPQSRERVFMISIRKDENDPNPYYEFPDKMTLKKKVDDIYEDDVDEKYYMKDENRVQTYVRHLQEDYPEDEGQDTEQNDGLWSKGNKKSKKRMICEYAGYGKNDERTGSHLKKQGNPDIVSTITCLVHFNKVVVEVEEE